MTERSRPAQGGTAAPGRADHPAARGTAAAHPGGLACPRRPHPGRVLHTPSRLGRRRPGRRAPAFGARSKAAAPAGSSRQFRAVRHGTVCAGLAVGRRPRVLTPEASARDQFGAELRCWRTARGLTQRELAALIWHSPELVSKVEKGQRWATWDLATRCDAALRTGGVLAGLWPAVERQRLTSDRRRRPVPAGGACPDLAGSPAPSQANWPSAR